MYDYNHLFNGTPSYDYSGLGSVFAAGIGILLFIGLIVLAVAVFMIVTFCIFFKKCGKPAWAAIIPYYSTWVENEIAGCHWVVFAASIAGTVISLLFNANPFGTFLLSLVSIFAGVCVCYNISKKFNKGVGFCVGLVLLPVVFFPILAFSKTAVYDKNVKVKNCAFFDVNF